jgi:Fis family transcriptional regulator
MSDHVRELVSGSIIPRAAQDCIDCGVRYPDFVRDCKRHFIQQVLDRNHGNQSHAARELGMHRNTLTRTLHELGMQKRSAKREEVKPETSAA